MYVQRFATPSYHHQCPRTGLDGAIRERSPASGRQTRELLCTTQGGAGLSEQSAHGMDETRLVAGYPGEYVVMARRKGTTWYVAGINGSDSVKTIPLQLDGIVKEDRFTKAFLDPPPAPPRGETEGVGTSCPSVDGCRRQSPASRVAVLYSSLRRTSIIRCYGPTFPILMSSAWVIRSIWFPPRCT